MSKINFTKMHGLGNCYIYINGFQYSFSEQELVQLAQKLSNVNTGIGSDGLILISPSTRASVRMRIFNKDGSEAKNCGNGLRCVAKYAYDHKLVCDKKMTIETLGGIVEASISGLKSDSLVTINMGKPRLYRRDLPMLGNESEQVISEPFHIDKHALSLTAVSMGNPHAVFFVESPNHNWHTTLGPKIEQDPRFPERINVEFINVISPTSLHCRVWERGSGVTQACGTGACASAVAAILNGRSPKDENITVSLEGGDLQIRWTSEGDVIMTGPAAYIATGTLI